VAGVATVTVPNGALLSAGQAVSGYGIPAGRRSPGIAGNVLTLSAAPTVKGASITLKYGSTNNAYTGTDRTSTAAR